MPSKSANGAVRCCSKNGRTCVTPKSCMETTFAMAQAECSAIEMRICTAEELERNKCCNTGCGFDDKLTWRTGSTTTTTSKQGGCHRRCSANSKIYLKIFIHFYYFHFRNMPNQEKFS